MASSQSLCSVLILSVFLHTAIGASDDPTLDVNPNAPKTRGNRFALAFMQNHARTAGVTQQQIGLFITTEQESSRFTLETRWPGVSGAGFTETSPGSGLWSRTEIARRGDFTFINLPAGTNGQPDIAVQNNGETDEAERQKGLFITAENANDELTIYVLSDELVSTDAYMAINCVEFPGATDYKYFIFSSDVFGGERFESRFLFTPCQDDTTVSVQASQTQTHPAWVLPSSGNPSARVEAMYGRAFNRFDTVMISNLDDLTGSIITSDKPLAVFSGHQCGTPTDDGTCDYLVEQLPPHPTYGDLFFMAPFAVRQSGELYRIGSLGAGAQVTINCECLPSSADGNNRVGLVSAGNGVYTATVGAGQYAECQTPQNSQTYCCVTSSQPVTMAAYTLGNLIDNLQNIQDPPLPFNPIGDPALVYIPPATSYLNSYSLSTAKNLTTQFQGFISYILPTRIFDNSPQDRQRFRVNGETYIPDQYEAINCLVGGSNEVCAYGATRFLGVGNFDLSYDNIEGGAFWGFTYGYAREVSFAYPLAFEMEPVGLAWIRAVDLVVLETVGTVDLMFSITRGDQSGRSRAFADTQDLSAIEGSDYNDPQPQNNGGPTQNGNLRWRAGDTLPRVPYVVTILDDDTPEPVEVVEVIVQCVAGENCYLPRTRYTITIIDDQGACLDLPPFSGGSISYDFEFFSEINGRPYGTVATYMCDTGSITGEPTRTCENGVWSGTEPSCGAANPVVIMFSRATFSFGESDGQGFVEIVANMAPTQGLDFIVTGGPSTQDFVVVSAAGLPGQVTFPAGQMSVRVPFSINNDEVGLEDLENYLASLSLTSEAIAGGVSLGAISQADVQVVDDDEVSVSVGQTTYSAQESDGSVTLSYVLNREAVRDVSFDVINTDGTATGGGIDYNSAGYSLNIPAGQTSVSRTVSITMDGVAGETPPETFSNSISSINTDSVVAGPAEATVQILDSDEPVAVSFGEIEYNFVENEVTGTIRVVTSRPSPVDFSFTVTAPLSDTQFIAPSGGSIDRTATFPAGTSSFDITFPINDDVVALEAVEELIATLSLNNVPTGVELGTPSVTVIRIQDNDEFSVGFVNDQVPVSESDGSVTLNIVSTPAARPVEITVITQDIIGGVRPATADVDYNITMAEITIPAFTTSTDFTVGIITDNVVEGDEVFRAVIVGAAADEEPLPVSQPQSEVTIVDDDVVSVSFTMATFSFDEGSGTGSVTIVKNGVTNFPFDIRVTGGPSTQTGIMVNAGGIDSTITFPADQQMITINFPIGDDDLGLEVLERYIANLEIIGSTSGVIPGTITSAEVQVRDDDEVSVGFNVDSVTVEESDGMFRMCVSLNRPAAENIIVSLGTQDGSAIDGQDYTSSSIPSELLIAAGETEACFTGDVIEDGTPGEGTESFTIVITGVDQSGVTISRETTQVIIQDSDDGSCDALPGIDNGVISYNIDKLDNFPDGTVATYTCNSGYILINGDSMRTCDVQVGSGLGSFGGIEPECIPVCDELGMIANGVIVYTGDMTAPHDVGTVATYSCNPGYELVINPGSEMRSCEDAGDGSGGRFSGQAPTCEPVCNMLPMITNGVIVYNIDMTAPYDVGTVATYSCDPGYELVINPGSEMRSCEDAGDGSGGRFSGQAPTCEPVCDMLPMITNGVIVYNIDMTAPYDVGTVATYSCDPGYELVINPGSEMRSCEDAGDGSGGRFSGQAPTCEPVCDMLPMITNGVIVYNIDMTAPYDVGTVATYSCDPGYELAINPGSEMRSCEDAGDGSGGRFSGQAPTCEPQCPPLPEIANGMITYLPDNTPDYDVGTTAIYICEDGFTLSGDVTRDCQSDRTFSGMEPVCSRIPVCADLPAIDNGVISYSSADMPRPIGTVASYACNDGFNLDGPDSRTCVENAGSGMFDMTAPTCIQITCDDLPALDNAVISYSSSISPRPVNTVATYECVDGYTLEGSVTRTCQEDEMFDGEEPRCVLTPVCVELEPLVNGGIDYGGRNEPFSVGTVATYFCNTGYALVDGPDSKTCVESDEGTGVFDPPQTPTCDPECDQIFVPPNAIVTYNTDPVPPFPAGALAMFECVEGFSPVTTSPGQPTTFPLPGELILLECGEIIEGEGGEFVRNGTSSQIELNCTRDCEELPAILYGMISYSPDMTANYSAGTVATYTCNDGFELVPGVGNSMRTCLPLEQMPGDDLRSEFDGEEPRCVPVCMELVTIPNGMISYSPDMTAPYSVDTVATYTCNDGFQFVAGVGDQMRTCTEVVESESTVVSGAEFSGLAPSCQRIPTDMTICTIADPLMVSPFTRSTSYTFMGTCEHALLQSCDDSVDFMVRTDFLTDSMDNGAVGVFFNEAWWISREDGSYESSEAASSVSGVPGRETTVYADSNVEVERGDNYTEIRVGGGIGVNVRHNYGDPSSIIVTVVTGSSLGETCGLCGTQTGDLRRSDGTIADITDRAQVEAFTMDYLTPADQQALRPIRRECSMIRNDTIIGDPLYSASLTKLNGGPDNLCYEVRGSDSQNYNLISDECVSVNALYQAMDIPEFGNIMGTIGVRAATNDQRCYNIRVEREGCRALVSGGVAEPAVIESTFASGGISVRRYPNRVRISTPNCDQVTLVMWVRCVTREGQDMLDFAVSRGANLRPTSHGLLGQFWNIPVISSNITGGPFYIVTVNPDDSFARSFTAEVLSRTWDKRRESCLYAGNSQGGAYNELQDSSFPADSVIQGRFSDYQTTGLYATVWTYYKFSPSACPIN
ncbi:uncharacterized protein LOC135335846 isoform X3 [Halichondria panicea]|uniref:uncharacterized protein LOC135335846 isoform X3 n=1 Tax=Halichondria panicea TaxID=6063 RepID=UPI00312B32C3